ncbi:unnamed protein product [Protopolystoma xenopodis]|uniref:Uncharacterized protein n=1 Tax=Protopolystoma xenopodis TaxID=117903 RepID=A0A448XKV8_9PLAT|nr:unnamed protein product [Protopolystoma xenopodis]
MCNFNLLCQVQRRSKPLMLNVKAEAYTMRPLAWLDRELEEASATVVGNAFALSSMVSFSPLYLPFASGESQSKGLVPLLLYCPGTSFSSAADDCVSRLTASMSAGQISLQSLGHPDQCLGFGRMEPGEQHERRVVLANLGRFTFSYLWLLTPRLPQRQDNEMTTGGQTLSKMSYRLAQTVIKKGSNLARNEESGEEKPEVSDASETDAQLPGLWMEPSEGRLAPGERVTCVAKLQVPKRLLHLSTSSTCTSAAVLGTNKSNNADTHNCDSKQTLKKCREVSRCDPSLSNGLGTRPLSQRRRLCLDGLIAAYLAISDGPVFGMPVSAEIVNPPVHFSTRRIDFGFQLVSLGPGFEPAWHSFWLVNTSQTHSVSIECLPSEKEEEDEPVFKQSLLPTVLQPQPEASALDDLVRTRQPGDAKTVGYCQAVCITFSPSRRGQFSETYLYEVNGAAIYSVEVTGFGVEPKFDIELGPLVVGKMGTTYSRLQSTSKVSVKQGISQVLMSGTGNSRSCLQGPIDLGQPQLGQEACRLVNLVNRSAAQLLLLGQGVVIMPSRPDLMPSVSREPAVLEARLSQKETDKR